MVDAGRMTATARRDIGACISPTEKRGSGVAYRCVMTFALAGDDLDWEFAFIRALGIRPVQLAGG